MSVYLRSWTREQLFKNTFKSQLKASLVIIKSRDACHATEWNKHTGLKQRKCQRKKKKEHYIKDAIKMEILFSSRTN